MGERFSFGHSMRVIPSLPPSLIPRTIAPSHTYVLPADTAWPQPGKKCNPSPSPEIAANDKMQNQVIVGRVLGNMAGLSEQGRPNRPSGGKTATARYSPNSVTGHAIHRQVISHLYFKPGNQQSSKKASELSAPPGRFSDAGADPAAIKGLLCHVPMPSGSPHGSNTGSLDTLAPRKNPFVKIEGLKNS